MGTMVLRNGKPDKAATEKVAQMGHNNPPEPTPIEAAKEEISLLDLEAANWFDGTPIENQAQADDVARLLNDARKAKKKFEAEHKVEKEPHLEAGKAVDAKWKPVIADAGRIVEIAKAAQTPWLIKQDEAKRKLEEDTRKAAEEAAAEARRLAEQNDGSLAAAKARDAAIEDAKRAEHVAQMAANEKASAKGAGMTRAVSLRTTWRCEVKDRRALLNHIAKEHPADLSAFLDDWAARAVRGGQHELPGVEAWAEKAAA